jgi:hypothetical protein
METKSVKQLNKTDLGKLCLMVNDDERGNNKIFNIDNIENKSITVNIAKTDGSFKQMVLPDDDNEKTVFIFNKNIPINVFRQFLPQ